MKGAESTGTTAAGRGTGSASAGAASQAHEAVVAAYHRRFDAQSTARTDEPLWLTDKRQAALDHFLSNGFPTTKREAWRKTHLGDLLTKPYDAAPATTTLSAVDLAAHLVEGAALTLVFVDGRYDAALSHHGELPEGVTVDTLHRALAAGDPDLEHVLGRGQDTDDPDTTPAALNTALFIDGACIHLKPGTRVDAPVHVLFVNTATTDRAATFPRLVVTLGQGAELQLVEHHIGLGDATYLVDAVTDLHAGPGATLRHVRIQDDGPGARHLGTVDGDAERDATIDTLSFTVGAARARVDVRVRLVGEGASTHMDGVFLATDDQHIDHRTHIDHAVAHTTSNENYKGVLSGKAHGVFTGHIMVRKDAQKTDSNQHNRNLLLSDKALVDTTPQLEIYADDVKCAHGSTIGRLDDDQVFYLRSRGFTEADARRVLTEAFAGEVIHKVPDVATRRRLEDRIADWFRAHGTARAEEEKRPIA